MLELRNIGVTINNGVFHSTKKQILSDISFSLPDGETLGIIGKSGCGKTTIANVILGIVRHSSGDVLLNGKSVRKQYSRLGFSREVQLITQDPETSFDPDLSVGESFREVLKIHKIPIKGTVLEKAVYPLLEDVGLDSIDLNKPPRYFSGGELQRMSIVRALLVSPRIMIFDEADSMLDTVIRIRLFDTLNRLRLKYGFSYIYITHDIRVLPHLVKTVLVMVSGKVMEYGPVDLLRTSGKPFIKMLRDSIFIGPESKVIYWKDGQPNGKS
jgi:ABC-type dipeptide/oligopeptide/nickel transport system ATPase subunit